MNREHAEKLLEVFGNPHIKTKNDFVVFECTSYWGNTSEFKILSIYNKKQNKLYIVKGYGKRSAISSRIAFIKNNLTDLDPKVKKLGCETMTKLGELIFDGTITNKNFSKVLKDLPLLMI